MVSIHEEVHQYLIHKICYLQALAYKIGKSVGLSSVFRYVENEFSGSKISRTS